MTRTMDEIWTSAVSDYETEDAAIRKLNKPAHYVLGNVLAKMMTDKLIDEDTARKVLALTTARPDETISVLHGVDRPNKPDACWVCGATDDLIPNGPQFVCADVTRHPSLWPIETVRAAREARRGENR